MRVAVLGLGDMGGPMASHVIAAGHEVTLYDPMAEALEGRVAPGVRVADSPAAAAEGVEVVSVVVRDDAQSIESIDGPKGVLRGASPGTIVLLHATVAPATVRRLGAACDELGVRFVDAGISGGRQGAEEGTLYVMCGGDPADIEAARPVIDTFARHVVRFGPRGAGMAAKLARNLMHYQVWVATHDAMALAEAAGLDMRAFEHLVRESKVADLIGHQLARDTTAPVEAASDPARAAWIEKMVRLGWKDLEDAFALAEEVGTDVTMGVIARHRFGPAMNLELYPT
jgi:3-hydroxyisobutyrate dehydrogenase-like beta-hydroxyacid dehydrogenase